MSDGVTLSEAGEGAIRYGTGIDPFVNEDGSQRHFVWAEIVILGHGYTTTIPLDTTVVEKFPELIDHWQRHAVMAAMRGWQDTVARNGPALTGKQKPE